MEIQITSIYFNEAKNRSSNYFRAELFINGLFVANIWNEGNGGITFYQATSESDKQLLEEAETYFLSIPDKTYQASRNCPKITRPSTLRNFIDDFVDDYLMKQAFAEYNDKLANSMIKGIVYGNESAFKVYNLGAKIDLLVTIPGYSNHIIQSIKRYVIPALEDGIKILNTNIPVSILLEAGLADHQFLKPD